MNIETGIAHPIHQRNNGNPKRRENNEIPNHQQQKRNQIQNSLTKNLPFID